MLFYSMDGYKWKNGILIKHFELIKVLVQFRCTKDFQLKILMIPFQSLSMVPITEILEQRPSFLIGIPMCTAFSILQGLNMPRMDPTKMGTFMEQRCSTYALRDRTVQDPVICRKALPTRASSSSQQLEVARKAGIYGGL